MARMRYGIRRPGRPPFGWAPDEYGAVSDVSGGIQIEVVTRHHEEFVRATAKPLGTSAIGHRVWLIGANHLAGHDAVPGQVVPTRKPGKARDASRVSCHLCQTSAPSVRGSLHPPGCLQVSNE